MKKILLISLIAFLTFSTRAEEPAGGGGAPSPGSGSAPAAPPPPTGGAPSGGSDGAPARPKWEEDLDNLGDDDEPAAGGGAPPPKPGDKPGEKPPGDKGATPPKPGDKPPVPPEDPTAQYKTPKELRDWASSRHKEAVRLEGEVKRLEGEMKALQSKPPQSQQQSEAMAQQLTALQKRVDEYEETIRYLNYEQSSEYKTKYSEPYQNAVRRAYKEVVELEVWEPTGEKDAEGQPVFKQRPATEADFDRIYGLKLGEASRTANLLFREGAAIVMQHRAKIRELAEASINARNEYRTKGKEIETQRKSQLDAQKAASERLWRTTNEQMSSNPKRAVFWGREENDPEANAELEKGFAFADQMFSEDFGKLPLEERIMIHAAIRHRVAGFQKLAYMNKKIRAELAAANATIEKLRGSGPGRAGGGGDTPAAGTGTWEEGIDKLPE